MNEPRLRFEVDELREEFPVHVDRQDGTVELTRIRYPRNWRPQVGRLKFDLPATYAQEPPTVHLPAEMTYTAGRCLRFRRSRFPGWRKWCVTFAGWWPRRHSLVTVTREMMGSLSDPSKTRLVLDPARPGRR